jgi:hypothetical protein
VTRQSFQILDSYKGGTHLNFLGTPFSVATRQSFQILDSYKGGTHLNFLGSPFSVATRQSFQILDSYNGVTPKNFQILDFYKMFRNVFWTHQHKLLQISQVYSHVLGFLMILFFLYHKKGEHDISACF